MIKEIQHKYAIIVKSPLGKEYIYKQYSNEDKLKHGIKLIQERLYKPKFRTTKIKITTEEDSRCLQMNTKKK